ncbi:hypothetical protein [Brevibacillus sp. H7]|uniref:hypothetical protein n=1 Tax=Brevibacillus sp. H7 TaxID=3349138 RepID=UPI003810F917
MWGMIWIHTSMGILAFLITFGAALAGNTWLVSLERAVYAFILFFLAMFPVRWLVSAMSQTASKKSTQENKEHTESSSVPADQESNPSESESSEVFTPLSFAGIDRITPAQDPATVADVIRRLTDE